MLNDFYELSLELNKTQMLSELPMGVMPTDGVSIAASAVSETAPPPPQLMRKII